MQLQNWMVARFVAVLTCFAHVASAAVNASTPGYYTSITTKPGNNFTFGRHYAILNLDLIVGLVAPINTTSEGQRWIASTANWINIVHQQSPPPLSIFTRIYYSNQLRPEVSSNTPILKALAPFGNATSASPAAQIYPAFQPLTNYDVVLQKTRYDASYGNNLLEILSTQGINTVILSGIRTSGVILSTVYTLFDKNYKVYVISNNSIENPPDTVGIDRAIKASIIPKLPASVITVEQAIAALGRSGPAIVYQ